LGLDLKIINPSSLEKFQSKSMRPTAMITIYIKPRQCV